MNSDEVRGRYAQLGALLKKLREQEGLDPKEVAANLGKTFNYRRQLERYEKGQRRPSRTDLLDLAIRGILQNTQLALNQLLKHAGYRRLNSSDLARYGLSFTKSKPTPQTVRWGPVDAEPAGILIDGTEKTFVAWSSLKTEVERKLLNQLGRHVPNGCRVTLVDFKERKNWLVRIVDRFGNAVGDIWFGPDPKNEWMFDGMVRAGKTGTVGETIVWQIFQRYSDGSYRRVAGC